MEAKKKKNRENKQKKHNNEKRKVPFRKLLFCKVDKALVRFISLFFPQTLVHSENATRSGNRK